MRVSDMSLPGKKKNIIFRKGRTMNMYWGTCPAYVCRRSIDKCEEWEIIVENERGMEGKLQNKSRLWMAREQR